MCGKCTYCDKRDEMHCEICNKLICDDHMHRIICTEAYHLLICPDCFKKHSGRIYEFVNMRKELTELYNNIDEKEDICDKWLRDLNEE